MKLILFIAALSLMVGCQKEHFRTYPHTKIPIPVDTVAVTKVDTQPKTPPLNIVCVGNSLTYGTASDSSYPEILQAMIGDTVINSGKGGESTTTMTAYYNIQVKQYFKDSGYKNILVAWEIGNEIYYYSGDTKCVNKFKAYTDMATKDGWDVYVINLPYRNNFYAGVVVTPGGDDSTSYTKHLNIADAMLPSLYGDKLIDVESTLHAYDPKYYFHDHVHFIKEGYRFVAQEVYKKIKP